MNVPELLPPLWKRVLALLLDLATLWMLVLLPMARLFGTATWDASGVRYQLGGWPGLFGVALCIGYFFVSRKLIGGTPWERVLRMPRR